MKRFTVDAAMPNWAKTPLPRGPVPARRVQGGRALGLARPRLVQHLDYRRRLLDGPTRASVQVHRTPEEFGDLAGDELAGFGQRLALLSNLFTTAAIGP